MARSQPASIAQLASRYKLDKSDLRELCVIKDAVQARQQITIVSGRTGVYYCSGDHRRGYVILPVEKERKRHFARLLGEALLGL